MPAVSPSLLLGAGIENHERRDSCARRLMIYVAKDRGGRRNSVVGSDITSANSASFGCRTSIFAPTYSIHAAIKMASNWQTDCFFKQRTYWKTTPSVQRDF